MFALKLQGERTICQSCNIQSLHPGIVFINSQAQYYPVGHHSNLFACAPAILHGRSFVWYWPPDKSLMPKLMSVDFYPHSHFEASKIKWFHDKKRKIGKNGSLLYP
jgi:hypothetical protein